MSLKLQQHFPENIISVLSPLSSLINCKFHISLHICVFSFLFSPHSGGELHIQHSPSTEVTADDGHVSSRSWAQSARCWQRVLHRHARWHGVRMAARPCRKECGWSATSHEGQRVKWCKCCGIVQLVIDLFMAQSHGAVICENRTSFAHVTQCSWVSVLHA